MVALNPENRPVEDAPLISQSALGVLAGIGMIATLGLGWSLARSSAGMPPFQIRPPAGVPVAGKPATGAPELHLVATDLKFDTKQLKVDAPGSFKVHLENQGAIEHDFSLEGVKGKAYAGPKKTGEGTFQITKPGTYTFFCSLPGHKEAGMTGTLVVGDGKSTAVTAPAGKSTAPAADAHASHATTISTQKNGNQLLSPRVVDGVKIFDLTARAVQWEVLPGQYEEAWTYNDMLPGPVIRVTEGDKVKVTLKNELPEETVMHFHGPRLPNAQDGVPDVTQKTIKVGETYTYEFTAEPAGTYVYHSHHNTAIQEPMGLYGVLIIDPKPGSAQAQRDAQYTTDVIQVVSEFQGNFLINGKAFPATEVVKAKVGEKIRIRLVNLGQTSHPMHLHGFHFKVVGTDGIPVKGEPLEKDTINIAPGERYDLEFEADNPGTWVFHCHILSHVANHGVEPGGMITVIQVS
jgi:FtsP/CotA-like multicopper oxidase with cupredoxin domain